MVNNAVTQIREIISGSYIQSNCSKCIASLQVAKQAAQLAPALLPDVMVDLCKAYKFHTDEVCEEDFRANTFGAIWVQILALGDMGGSDGQYVCSSLSTNFCKAPSPIALNITFPKPKPKNATRPKPSGERAKILHLSDFHLDPRYAVGSEANCTSSLCCRANNANTAIPQGQVSLASPLYGAFKCDTPYDLGLSALEAIGPLTGTGPSSPPLFTIYTGDLVSHESQTELSRSYTEYAEASIYGMMKSFISSPIFAVLGNHDGNPEAIDAPHSMPGPLGQQMSWNFDHVAGLWEHNNWLPKTAVSQARVHYGAYSVKAPQGLRIITFNTDFWYRSNFLNFINTTNPDVSGTFEFMIQELQAAEDAGERVWILGHVLSGWDGSNPLPNPTNLFYQIVDRYSPHVIANIFFGHTHEDQFMIYYANNGTVRNSSTAQSIGWIGPSITPLTNLNSGFRMYEVDTGSWDVYESHTYYSNVSTYQAMNSSATGPVWKYEYSARDTYGPQANWSRSDPLNATFWHRVTEAMERNNTLVSVFNTLEGKMSVKSPNCTNAACANAKICYMRSGSVPLGRQCPQGYGSVQSSFSPAPPAANATT